jgi:pimeloyl-ACP methyl ester carboxylesterase
VSYLQNGGMQLYYEVLGDGRPLVFSHGLGGSVERIRDVVLGLPGKLILYDNRAHGRTRAPLDSTSLSFSHMADDIGALLQHLDIDQAFVGGVSMGAGVALAFGLRYPARTSGLILSRPAWLDQPHPRNLEFAPILAELLSRQSVPDAMQAFTKTSHYTDLFARRPAAATALLTTAESINPQMLIAAYRAMPASTPMRSLEEMRGINQPVLVIGDRCDPVHPIEIAECWARQIPGACFRTVPSRLDDPQGHVREFQKAVTEFLEDISQ